MLRLGIQVSRILYNETQRINSHVRHGGTHNTSDNFPAQKISFKISVALHPFQLDPKATQPIYAGLD